ncbi:hypothetical protein FRC01_003778 [Tulasnella sp. 417]|nr:hypothetical protein FRC01_003778 [Tulasnella sp. 417]
MTSIQRKDTEKLFEPKNRVNGSESTVQLCRSNDKPFIHRLPVELLLQIFECAVEAWYYSHDSTYYRHLCTFSRVCIRWYSIIQRSPRLWTTVPGSIKEEGLRKILQQSLDKLLDIQYHPGKEEEYSERDQTFYNVLGPASGRWRTLNLTVNNSGMDTCGFLQLPAPNIKQLSFEDIQWTGLGLGDAEFLGGNCPYLKDIHISGVTCEWSQAAFMRVENLKISETWFESVAYLLDIIRPLPQLRRLEICDCICNCDPNEGVIPEPQTVSLPNLQFLRVEFWLIDNVMTPPEQFLTHLSAPPPCPLYVTFLDLDQDDDGSFVDTLCDWLFGRQTRAVLEGVEYLKLGFARPDEDLGGSVDFELFSGAANVKGGFKGSRIKDIQYVLECIQGVFQRSNASETFTKLTLSGGGAILLNHSQIISQFKDLPPITHLELVEPVWPLENSPSENISEDLTSCTPSAFAMIKNVTLREVSPDAVLDIVLGVLGDPQERTPPMSECRVETLDHVEIHVEVKDFHKAEAVMELLRNEPRIGKVDLYVAL